MAKREKQSGFTLLEVLVATMIVAIVLTAAATMASALSSAKTANDQMSRDTTACCKSRPACRT